MAFYVQNRHEFHVYGENEQWRAGPFYSRVEARESAASVTLQEQAAEDCDRCEQKRSVDGCEADGCAREAKWQGFYDPARKFCDEHAAFGGIPVEVI